MSKLITLAPVAIAAGGTVWSLLALRYEKDSQFRHLILTLGIISVLASLIGIFLTLPEIVKVIRELREQAMRGEWEDMLAVIVVLTILGLLMYWWKASRSAAEEIPSPTTTPREQKNESRADNKGDKKLTWAQRHGLDDEDEKPTPLGAFFLVVGVIVILPLTIFIVYSSFQFLISSGILPPPRDYAKEYKEAYEKEVAKITVAIEQRASARLYSERASLHKSRGNYDLAVEDMTLAIRLEPQKMRLWQRRGEIYLERKDYDLAIADFTKAIELDPIGSNYEKRGGAYWRNDDYLPAIADYTRAIEMAPSAKLYMERGEMYEERGHRSAAIADYQKASSLGPDDETSYHGRVARHKLKRLGVTP